TCLAQLGGLPVQVSPSGSEVGQIQAVLDQVQAKLVADYGRPVRRPGPALHRETRVDPEPEGRHFAGPVFAATGRCTAAASLTFLTHSNRAASRGPPARVGRSTSARARTVPIAAAASSASPAALAASMATPNPAGSRSRCRTGSPSNSALSWPT